MSSILNLNAVKYSRDMYDNKTKRCPPSPLMKDVQLIITQAYQKLQRGVLQGKEERQCKIQHSHPAIAN